MRFSFFVYMPTLIGFTVVFSMTIVSNFLAIRADREAKAQSYQRILAAADRAGICREDAISGIARLQKRIDEKRVMEDEIRDLINSHRR